MNPKLLFWVPAALRMVLALLGVAVVWYLFGATYALGIAFVLMAMMVFVQLSYLFQLSNWLDNPQSAKLPDGWGAWTSIFARLYRMRRDDEKTRPS